MDLSTVVVVVALSLVSADVTPFSLVGTTNTTTSSPPKSSRTCPCYTVTPAAPTSTSSHVTPIWGILTVNWTNTCEGFVELVPYPAFNKSSLPVCQSQDKQDETILENVCENKKGCKEKLIMNSKNWENGYMITEKGANETSSCWTLRFKCEVDELSDYEGQLKACKVVIALLSIVLLVIFLMRFTRPTVKALQKRLSDRRQHHWVGPTQSHSVSYHRGKSVVGGDDEEKRSSYPALERLTVGNNSPSYNRNFYNF